MKYFVVLLLVLYIFSSGVNAIKVSHPKDPRWNLKDLFKRKPIKISPEQIRKFIKKAFAVIDKTGLMVMTKKQARMGIKVILTSISIAS